MTVSVMKRVPYSHLHASIRSLEDGGGAKEKVAWTVKGKETKRA